MMTATREQLISTHNSLSPALAKTRKTMIEYLAAQVTQSPELWDESNLRPFLEVWAHPALLLPPGNGPFSRDDLTIGRAFDAFDDYRLQLNRLQQLTDGDIDWTDIDAELVGGDRDAAAHDIQQSFVEETLSLLLNGR
jgi:hypothetical protein